MWSEVYIREACSARVVLRDLLFSLRDVLAEATLREDFLSFC